MVVATEQLFQREFDGLVRSDREEASLDRLSHIPFVGDGLARNPDVGDRNFDDALGQLGLNGVFEFMPNGVMGRSERMPDQQTILGAYVLHAVTPEDSQLSSDWRRHPGKPLPRLFA